MSFLPALNPRTPTQALLWKCWLRTRWKLFFHQAVTLIILPVIYVRYVPEDRTLAELSEANVTILIASLFILFASCGSMMYRMKNAWDSSGFVLDSDYKYPISSLRLSLVPQTYLVAMFLVAYTVPSVALHFILGYALPHWLSYILIAEFMLLVMMLYWTASDGWLTSARWVFALALYWGGYLVPDITRDETTGQIDSVSLIQLVIPVLICIVAPIITTRGVKLQRCGDVSEKAIGDSLLFRIVRRIQSLSFLKSPCPTDSPLLAEFWLIRQKRGLFLRLLTGLGLGVLIAAMVAGMDVWSDSPGNEGINLFEIAFFAGIFLIVVAIVGAVTSFGVSYIHETPRVSVFLRTRPLATSKLLYTRFAVTFAGLLLVALGMIVVLYGIGGLMLNAFSSAREEFDALMSVFLSQSASDIVVQSLRTLISLASILLVFCALITGLLLIRNSFLKLGAGVVVYLLVATVILGFFADSIEISIFDFLVSHLWILVVGLPVAVIYFSYDLLKNHVTSLLHLSILFVVGAICYWLTNTDIELDPETTDHLLLFQSFDLTYNLLPLFALLFALWTMSRIRHT